MYTTTQLGPGPIWLHWPNWSRDLVRLPIWARVLLGPLAQLGPGTTYLLLERDQGSFHKYRCRTLKQLDSSFRRSKSSNMHIYTFHASFLNVVPYLATNQMSTRFDGGSVFSPIFSYWLPIGSLHIAIDSLQAF